MQKVKKILWNEYKEIFSLFKIEEILLFKMIVDISNFSEKNVLFYLYEPINIVGKFSNARHFLSEDKFNNCSHKG